MNDEYACKTDSEVFCGKAADNLQCSQSQSFYIRSKCSGKTSKRFEGKSAAISKGNAVAVEINVP